MNSIGKNIQRLRANRGLSQNDLAELVGSSQGQIGNIESGRSNGSIGLLNRIANVFGIKLSDLTSEQPEPEAVHA